MSFRLCRFLPGDELQTKVMATPKRYSLQIFEKVDILTPTPGDPHNASPPWNDIFLKVWTLNLGGIPIPAWGLTSFIGFGVHFHEEDSAEMDLF